MHNTTLFTFTQSLKSVKPKVDKNLLLRTAIIFLISFLTFSLHSCTSKTKTGSAGSTATSNADQPTLDSPFVFNYFKNDPKLKEQLETAKDFYRERGYKLGWFKENKLVPQAKEMLAIIAKSDDDGLDPKDYQFKDLNKMFADLEAAGNDEAKLASIQKETDLALSATYFVWASDYYRGKANPKENKGIDWDVKKNKIKLHKALMTVLEERDSKYPYADFKPLHPEYDYLKTALIKYRKIQAAGGWPALPAGTKLKQGDKSPAVAILQKRLAATQAVSQTDTGSVYGPGLVAAVKTFQAQNGLKPDGAVGGETLRLLNIPVEKRITQILLNMERWRWIPKSFEPDYLLVNIPEYKLHVVEKNKEVMNMNVIVGKTLNQTKVFSDKLEVVALSPYWNVPLSILQKEIGPKVAGNPGYLDRLDMEVVSYKGQPISPSSIDWNNITESNLKYIVRRRPGPKNDLGDVKFLFPNTNDIYFHDTPHDELFSQTKRNFSHGCVRLEKPIDLAVYLLRNNPGWDRAKIESTIAMRKERQIPVKQVLPVYLVYFTSWADAAGNVHFRDDIYGHDTSLAKLYIKK